MSSTLSRFERERGIPLKTLLWKRASSRVEGRISWFFSSCGGKLGVPLMLQRGPQGPTHVASEKSSLFPSCEGHAGIALESLLVNRTMSRVLSVNSAFISGGDRDLRLQLKVHLGSQASSGVEAWNSAFLSSCQRCQASCRVQVGNQGFLERFSKGVMPPIMLCRNPWCYIGAGAGEPGLISS